MLLKDLGEFGLIHRIAAALPRAPNHVAVGVGDDVAVLDGGEGEYLLATIDSQVEGVHFTLDTTTPYQLGKRVVAINVSDIAAMGGRPLYALVSLMLPPETEVELVDELYRGMSEQLQPVGAAIVGGNVSRSLSGVTVDLCLLGRVARDKVLLRSGALPGDAVLVTGALGDSRAGLELLGHPEWKVLQESRRQVLERHLTPQPRLMEGQVLADSGRVHAMLDVSDGLLGDLQHICDAGGVGAELWLRNIPCGSGCLDVASHAGVDPLHWALSGGEDYELLFTVAPEHVEEIVHLLAESSGPACARIGTVTDRRGEIRLVGDDGRAFSAGQLVKGWDHFA